MNILDLEFKELENFIKEAGQPGFRASQLYGWIAKGVTEPEDMRNVPHGLCPEDELILEIVGADNGDGWFHSDSCNQFGVWSLEFEE